MTTANSIKPIVVELIATLDPHWGNRHCDDFGAIDLSKNSRANREARDRVAKEIERTADRLADLTVVDRYLREGL